MFRSIRTQLFMIQTVSLALLLVIGLFAIAQVRRLSMDATRQYAVSSAMQAKSGVESLLESVRVSATGLSYSAPAQELLTTRDADKLRLAQVYRQFSDNVSYAMSTNSNIVDVCLLSSEGDAYTFGTQAAQALRPGLSLYESAGAQGEMFTGFFGTDEESGTEYYAFILPINSAIPGEGFSQRVGLCFVLCRTSAVLDILRAAVLEGMDLTLCYGEGRRWGSAAAAPEAPRRAGCFPWRRPTGRFGRTSIRVPLS